MVDEGRAARLLRGIADRIRRLDEATVRRDDDPTSLWLDGVKYLFITAIEGCIDVAHHLASSESWQAPDTNSRSSQAWSSAAPACSAVWAQFSAQ